MTTKNELQPMREPREVGPPLPSKVTAEWPDWSTVPAETVEVKRLGLELLPPPPRANRKPLLISFVAIVVLPTALASFYFFKIASNQYVSEFRFSISQVSSAVPGSAPPGSGVGSTASSLAAGLSAITGGAGGGSVSPAGEQNYVVADYIKSDQAVRDLLTTIDLRAVFSDPHADSFSRLNKNASFEQLASYWRGAVNADYDPVMNIAWASVRTFEPKDSFRIADRLVQLSEKLVNSVEARANKDVVAAADKEVDRTRDSLAKLRADMRKFRDSEGEIDPTQSLVPANISQISGVEATIIQLNTQLASSERITANNPANKVIISQIIAAKAELKRLRDEVAKKRSGDKVLSDVIGRYEALNFDVQYQQAMAMSAMQAREQAYANANSQHLFMTPYVQPSLPSMSTYPNRLSSSAYTCLVLCGIWIVIVLMKRTLDEHS